MLLHHLGELPIARVALGDGSDLCAWMNQQRRRAPMRYAWDAATKDKHGSYWINVNDIDPAEDNRGPVAFKKHVAGVILTRAIERAWSRA